MSSNESKAKASQGETKEEKVKKNNKNKRDRKGKKKDFIKRNILVRLLSLFCRMTRTVGREVGGR